MGCMDGEEAGARGWRVMYRLFRPGRWSRGLHVPRSAPLDPYFHFLVEGKVANWVDGIVKLMRFLKIGMSTKIRN